MKKIFKNSKGFALVETIIVSIFMVSIFMILYSNYLPLMGKYEKRDYYDDVDTKYKAFWLKYMIEDSTYSFPGVSNGGYTYFSCNNITSNEKRTICANMIDNMRLKDNQFYKEGSDGELLYVVVITNYKLDAFKNTITGSDLTSGNANTLGKNISDGFLDYILSLPDYTNGDDSNSKYRILIEFYDTKNNIFKYANIEVNKK